MSREERRLAAIMFTDIVGYTSLSQRNEALAMRLLERHRRTVRPLFGRHGGMEVKTIGDAFLVEFASALEAVRCAYEIQQSMHELNGSNPEEMRTIIRVGVHLGDVIHSQNDVYGDAVNVASRIEPLAEPGGICVSEQVYDQIRNKFEFPLVSLGKKELKNVGEPVEVFKVSLPWQSAEMAGAQHDKRRIAVLPFSNISPDPNDEYFADGMTEELIATMSRLGGLKVIARTSVMGYKGGQKKISEVARELEVGTVLEGSVRKAGNRIRVTIQLIDSHTSEHLWAESYERELKDVFAIQSEISNTVAEALKVRLTSQEKALIEKKQTSNPEAHTLYLKGRFYLDERTKDNVNKALRYFRSAVDLDPDFALAYSGLADCYNILADYTWMNPEEAAPQAMKNALKALEIDDSLAEAHASLALTLSTAWDFSAAERELKRAIELRPNYAPAYHWYFLLLGYNGRVREAREVEERALEIDPYSRVIGMGYAISFYLLNDGAEAKRRLQKLTELYPDFSTLRLWKSGVHVFLGDKEDAVREAKMAFETDGSTNSELNLAAVYAEVGRFDEAQRTLDHAKERATSEHLSPSLLGLVEISMGHFDEAFAHFDQALKEKDTGILMMRSDLWFERYRSDPRWKRLEERMPKTQTSA
ncbi:MAG: tetratricopeptide repeat protein [Thaumarchaeota archaeon]|nr:tetratricopeptide repeat protein [Nitrososphaerota archaeon]